MLYDLEIEKRTILPALNFLFAINLKTGPRLKHKSTFFFLTNIIIENRDLQSHIRIVGSVYIALLSFVLDGCLHLKEKLLLAAGVLFFL
ncbi:hypothetical protein ACJX0J_022552, partial [Zea mays]